MKQPPSVKSFLIADQVFRQEGNGKWCVIGIFDRIVSPTFPVLHLSLGLYLTLADAEGEYALDIEFLDSSGHRISHFGGIHLKIPDRLVEVGIGFQTGNLPIPAPGTYHFRILLDGRPAANDFRLVVEQREVQRA